MRYQISIVGPVNTVQNRGFLVVLKRDGVQLVSDGAKSRLGARAIQRRAEQGQGQLWDFFKKWLETDDPAYRRLRKQRGIEGVPFDFILQEFKAERGIQ